MNENNNPISFIKPFEELSHSSNSREREQISEGFSKLVDETFFKFAENARIYHDGSRNLLLTLPVDGSNSYTIALNEKLNTEPPKDEWESAEEIRKEVAIQRISGGFGRERFSYRMGSDGVVRRYNNGDSYKKVQERRALGEEPPRFSSFNIEEAISYTESAIESLKNELENSRLARAHGLNDQPIEPEEFEKLRDFVTQPEVEYKKLF